MARIVVRRNKRKSGSVGASDNGNDNAVNVDRGTSVIDGESGAGESDESIVRAAGTDNQPDGGDDDNGTRFVDPADTASSSGDTGTGKRRGRPRGSRNAKRTSPAQATKDISQLLFSLHLGMASFFKSEVIALTEEEAQNLGGAITRVTDLYDIRILPEKYMAWVNLGIVGSGIYGPRLYVLSQQKKRAHQKPIPVVTMPATNDFVPQAQGGVN